MKRKKLLSFLLAIALLLQSVPAFAVDNEQQKGSSQTEQTTQDAAVAADDITVSGTTSVGNLVANTINEDEQTAGDDDSCRVIGLEISGKTVSVDCNTDRDSDVVVAIYTEDQTKMLASGRKAITKDDTSAEVTIDIDEMPQYYVAKAYLLDSDTHEPLSPDYVDTLHTKEFEEFYAKTTEDFEAEQVLNLDDSEEENFAVFSDDTVLVEEEANVNQITDNGDHTYTVTNADSTFTSLKAGDSFSYTYADGTQLIIVVKSITVDGTTVTIVEDTEAALDDVFDYVKIESDGQDQEVKVDNSDLEDGVSYIGEGSTYTGEDLSTETENTAEEENGAQTVDVAEGEVSDESNAMTVDVSWEGSGETKVKAYLLEKEIGATKINANVGFGASAEIKVYIDDDWNYVELKQDYMLSANGTISRTASGAVEMTKLHLPLGKYTISPVPGVIIQFTPSFLAEANVSIKLDVEITATLGFRADTQSGLQNLSSQPRLNKGDLKVEGTVFVGVSLEPKVAIISDCVASASLKVQAGVEAKGSQKKTLVENSSEKHTCQNCIDMELSVQLEGSGKIKLVSALEFNRTFVNLKAKFANFYWSIDHGVFGRGQCPYRAYRVTVKTVDQGGIPFGCTVGISGQDDIETLSSGTGTVYLPNGTYTLTMKANALTATKNLKVDGEATSITLKGSADSSSGGSSGGGSSGGGSSGGGGGSTDGNIVDSGTCGDNLTWTLDDAGTLTISGTGAMNNYSSDSSVPWYSQRSSIKTVKIGSGVTSIGDRAFEYCDSLTSVTIPDSVTSIGKYAFYDCNGLTSVTIPNSVTSIGEYAFYDCDSLTSVTIPNSVTSIGNGAFAGCGLTSVTIPNSVTSIGGYAFYDCDSLTSVTIGNSVTSIGNDAFADCDSLTSVTIPNSVTSIGDDAFYHCSSLTSVTIPNSVTSIGTRAFSDCDSLTSVTIPDSVTSIGDEAFWGCDSLTSVTIGNSVTSIGDEAFAFCDSLTSITVDSGNPNYSSQDGVLYNKDKTTLIQYPIGNSRTSFTIPNSVTSIGKYAFEDCDSLTSVTIPNSVTSIGDDAFFWCNSLTSIYFRGDLPSIGSNVFYKVTATAYYPSTWTTVPASDAYGGTLTWTPYVVTDTVDAEESITVEEVGPAPDEEESTEDTEEPEEEPDESGITVEEDPLEPESEPEGQSEEPAASAEELPNDVEEITIEEQSLTRNKRAGGTAVIVNQNGEEVPVSELIPTPSTVVTPTAKYSGTVSGDETKTAVFQSLEPNQMYVLIVVADTDTDWLDSQNLLYIAQGTSDENGALSFAYIPRTTADSPDAAVFGAANKKLSDAEITVEAEDVGEEDYVYVPIVTVTYDGEELEEDEDYRVTYTDDGAGTLSVTITGRGAYSGTVKKTCIYRVSLSAVDDEYEIMLSKDGEATLSVVAKPSEVTYAWYTGVYDAEEYDYIWTQVEDASEASYTATKAGAYKCVATAENGKEDEVWFEVVPYVSFDDAVSLNPDTENTITSGNSIVYSFTPSEVGAYYFCIGCQEGTRATAKLYNSEKKRIDSTEVYGSSEYLADYSVNEEREEYENRWSTDTYYAVVNVQEGSSDLTCWWSDVYPYPEIQNYQSEVYPNANTKTATLKVEATGTDLTYQWMKYDTEEDDYVVIPNADSNSYTAAEAGEYRCKVIAKGGFSRWASFTVYDPIVSSGTLKSGTNEYTITNGETQYYSFTPTKTITYYFYSASAQDTYGWLIDGDQGIVLLEDDDGNGYNFMLEAELTAGKTYYIGANFLNRSSSGTIRVVCAETAPIYASVKLEYDSEAVLYSNGQTIIRVSASSSNDEIKDFTYQWKKYSEDDGYTDISGANSAKLTVTEAGEYRCIVVDPYGNYDYASITVTESDADCPHDWGNGKVTTEATCKTAGVKTYTCSLCGETKTESIAKLTTHTWDGGKVTKAATCTADGVKTYTCTVCGETKTEAIAKLGHKYGSWTVTTKATCTAKGVETRVCANDNSHKETRSIDALGHSWDSGKVTKAATCGAAGVKTYTCSRCKTTKTEAIPATGNHTYKTTTTKAKPGANGKTVTKCSVCGTVKSTTTIYAPKTLTLSKTTYTYNGKAQKPTVKVKDSKGNTISSSNYTVSYASGRKNVGKYKVTVKFKSTSSKYSGTLSAYFTINPKGTALKTPTAGSKSFTAKWTKLTTQTTGYIIQYSTSSKFTSAKTVTITSNKTTSKKITKLTAKKKYYVRIRTYKTVSGTKHYSAWSSTKTVTTKK